MMNHFMRFALSSLFLTLCILNVSAQNQVPYSQRMANSQMQRSGNITVWDYPNGLFVESVLRVYDLYKQEKYFDYARNHANATVNASSGKLGSKFKFTAYNIDYVNPGMFLFGVNALDPKPHYKIALDTLRKQLEKQPRILNSSDGGFWHKLVYPHQMWLDGLYMGTRFYASYEKAYSQNPNYNDIVNQYVTIHEKTYDPDFQLNYHAWSAMPSDPNSFWANKTEPFLGCTKEFWGRGLGWYAAALVDVIEVLPEDYQRRSELIDILNQVAAGIKRWQDPASGCWFQLLRYDATFKSAKGKSNYIEASASSMFTYALLKAVRIGAIDRETYLPVATKAYNGLITNFISTDASGNISLDRICQSAGLGPASNQSRDGSASYYLDGSDAGRIVSNDLKGVGPFIMASVEHEKMLLSGTNKRSELLNKQNFDIHVSPSQISISGLQNIEVVNIYNMNGALVKKILGNNSHEMVLPNQFKNGLYLFVVNNAFSAKRFIN